MDAEAGEPGEHARPAVLALPRAPERPAMEGGIGGRLGFGHVASFCAEILEAAFGIAPAGFVLGSRIVRLALEAG